MFDIKKFLAENTLILAEDDEFRKLGKVLEFAKAKALVDFHEYLKRADTLSKRHVAGTMREYEAAAKAIENYWKKQKGPNYNVGRGR